MYVQTCNSLADQWAAEFPDRFHIVDSVQLDDESAQRELLSWLGYMPAEVSVRAGLWRERKPPVMSRQRTVAHNPDEILYAATGFLHVRREVYLTIQQKLDLPVCNERYGRPSIPFFQPMVHPIDRTGQRGQGSSNATTTFE